MYLVNVSMLKNGKLYCIFFLSCLLSLFVHLITPFFVHLITTWSRHSQSHSCNTVDQWIVKCLIVSYGVKSCSSEEECVCVRERLGVFYSFTTPLPQQTYSHAHALPPLTYTHGLYDNLCHCHGTGAQLSAAIDPINTSISTDCTPQDHMRTTPYSSFFEDSLVKLLFDAVIFYLFICLFLCLNQSSSHMHSCVRIWLNVVQMSVNSASLTRLKCFSLRRQVFFDVNFKGDENVLNLNVN